MRSWRSVRFFEGFSWGTRGGVHAGEDDVLVHQAFRDVLAGGQLVHHVEQHLFHDGAQASGAGAGAGSPGSLIAAEGVVL